MLGRSSGLVTGQGGEVGRSGSQIQMGWGMQIYPATRAFPHPSRPPPRVCTTELLYRTSRVVGASGQVGPSGFCPDFQNLLGPQLYECSVAT